IIALVLMAATILIHYEALRQTTVFQRRVHFVPRRRILIVIVACLVAHLLEIWVYAAALAVMASIPGFGAIVGSFDGRAGWTISISRPRPTRRWASAIWRPRGRCGRWSRSSR